MTDATQQLIERLAANAQPVRPLVRPWTRAAVWCSVSIPYLLLVYLVWPRHAGISIDSRFAIEEAAAAVTAVTAAVAAFASVVPGYSRKWLYLPLLPLAVWLGHLGAMCASDVSASGGVPPVASHWFCLPATLIAGLVPAIAIVVMLRRGAPLTPRLTIVLAALAAAGIANFGIRFVHAFDASLVILVWHLLAVFALSIGAAALGDRVLSWRHLETRRR